MNNGLKRRTAWNPPGFDIPGEFFANWYRENGRSFPWRVEGVSPFAILIAEVLLKQTRAEMVAQVWPALVETYPNPGALASADHDELFSMIAGLGFGNQRSRALLSVASAVMRAGAVPPKLDDLMALPQVGMYCAHAVACFGFAQRVPIVDSNVIRVFSRIAGIEPPKDIRRAPEVWKIAQHLLPEHSFVEHNYGLLDFCAAVCKPRVPSCVKCPIAANCAHEQRLGTATAQAWGRSYQ